MWNTNEAITYSVSEGEECVVWEHFFNQRMGTKNYCAWLVRFDRPIAMIRYMVNERGLATLCDIEVRSTARGYGVGAWFISWLETHVVKSTLYTTGSYTPEGYRSLKDHLLISPEYVNMYPEPGVRHSSMAFVHNWDEYSLK